MQNTDAYLNIHTHRTCVLVSQSVYTPDKTCVHCDNNNLSIKYETTPHRNSKMMKNGCRRIWKMALTQEKMEFRRKNMPVSILLLRKTFFFICIDTALLIKEGYMTTNKYLPYYIDKSMKLTWAMYALWYWSMIYMLWVDWICMICYRCRVMVM